MATPIKRIEKEFLLKVLYDEQIPVVYLRDRTEHTFILIKPARKELEFKINRPVIKLKAGNKIDLMFDYRGQRICFSIVVNSIKKDDIIICDVPEVFYRNLDRSYSRINAPQNIQVQFISSGDNYKLSFPNATEYETTELNEFFRNIDPKNMNTLIAQMAEWVKHYVNGYKLLLFKDDIKPESTEEHILVQTGRILYLPQTTGNFLLSDPYPRKRIITGEMFERYLESTGEDIAFADDACAQYLKAKRQNGVLSDAWIPVLFQNYVIGYIHIWVNTNDMPSISYSTLDVLYQFAQVLSYSLKINGYFESGKLKNDLFGGRVIDMSASGLLFAYPNQDTFPTVLPGNEIKVKLTTPQRTVNAAVKIVRRYEDDQMNYFGCSFIDMEPEDIRFLFEFLYGKPFTDADAKFFIGQV